ncbi:hypothetical protein Tco_1465463 [Tanacetum coccineum]
MYYPRFTKVIIHYFLTQDKIVSWRNKIGMHTSKDDYLINTLRFVSAKEATQIYGAILPESLTSPKIKETKAYKTYLGFATGATPPKIARKFKKASPSKKDLNLNLVPMDEEPKSAKKKDPAKKTTRKQTSRVVIRDTPVESSFKRKEKGKDEDDINNEQDFRSEGSDQERDSDDDNTQFDSKKRSDPEHETDENESDSDSDQEENEEEIGDDEEEEEDEFVRTPSNDSDDETKISDKAKGDEDEEMDYTTSQLYNDVDIRLNKPVQANDETKTEVPVTSSSHSSDLASKFLNFSDIPHTEAEIVSPMDVHVHHEVPSKKTPTLLTVPVLVITKSSPIYSTIIPQSIPSFTHPPSQSTLTPPLTTKAPNPPSTLLDFASVFQFDNRVTTLEKEVTELKKDNPLKTQVTALVDEHLDAILGATRDEFLNYLSASITTRITKMVTESLEHAILGKESSQPQSSYEAAALLTKFELKKILIDKMDKSKSYLAAPEHRECYDGLIKYYELDKTLFSTYDKVYSLKRSRKDKDKDEDPSVGSDRGFKKRKTSKDAEPTKEEPEFEVTDSDMPQDQEENPGNDDEEPKGRVTSKRDWFTKPKRPPTDPDWNDRKTPQQGPTQSWLMTLASSADKKFLKGIRTNYAELEYDFEECYKALSEKLDWENLEGGNYPFDLTKPLLLVMNQNRQKALKTWFQIFEVLLKSPMINMHFGVFLIEEINVMRKHRYGYLKENVVRRADNDLYKFKEGDFPCLRINDIEDMLLFVVQNRLTNLSGDDVSDFAIALRMFTRSIVIQKRVDDLQLAIESYQKKINVTKPETTKLGTRKKDPYTPYQDPQGFIYVDTIGRNRLMRSDELYNFSDGTLTRLQTSLEHITKNIHMEYLPKRR